VLATNFQQITKRCLDESSIIHIQQVLFMSPMWCISCTTTLTPFVDNLLENKGTKRCFFSIYENKISLVDLPDIFSLKHMTASTKASHDLNKIFFTWKIQDVEY
jgi:hypothetical protein